MAGWFGKLLSGGGHAAEHASAMRKYGEGAADAVFKFAEVGGASFGWAYANGRWGKGGLDAELDLAGVPMDIAAGVALGALSVFGAFGEYGKHVNNLAAGSLASWTVRTGSRMGRSAAGAAASTSGYVPQFSAGRRTRWSTYHGHPHTAGAGVG